MKQKVATVLGVKLIALFALLCASPATAQTISNFEDKGIESLRGFATLVGRPASPEQVQLDLGPAVGLGNFTIQDINKAALKLGMVVDVEKLSLKTIQERGGPAILHLKNPDSYVTLAAIGSQGAIVHYQGIDVLFDNASLNARYDGTAVVLKATPENVVAPRLQVDEVVRVVQLSSFGQEIETTVHLLNRGKAPLRLKVERTSCNCTGAELSAEEVLPGQSGNVKIKMQAVGWDSKTVMAYLSSNDPNWPAVTIALQVKMPKSVVPNPRHLVIRAVAGQGNKRLMTLLLPTEASLDEVAVTLPFMRVKVLEVEKIRSGSIQRLEISVAPNAPIGKFVDKIIFRIKGADLPQITVPIEGVVEPDISVVPRQVFLGSVVARQVLRKTVIVQSESQQAFSIVSTSSTDNSSIPKVTKDVIAASHAVEIDTTIRGNPDSVIRHVITLTFSNGEMIDIPVVGMIVHPEKSTASKSGSAEVTAVQVGRLAPEFSTIDMNGNIQKLANLRGKKNVLLTFFPKCFTGGCAGQLASLQAVYATLEANDTVVLAVSTDPARDQVVFAASIGVAFPLIPDTDRKISTLYGAVQNVQDLAARQSVLIDKEGIVRWIDKDVNVHTHGADVLKRILAMRSGK